MRQLASTALLGSLVFFCGTAFASAELAEAKQCMQCHKVKEDFAGPAFHKIAQARKGQRDAISRMTATIRQGSEPAGGPHWGTAKMPNMAERPQVSKAEARKLAQWILKQ
jgi:cytochrome c